MRRISMMLAAIMVVTLLLAACGGKKDAAGVVKDLDRIASDMDSYQGTGRMILHTGEQPLEYQVEVWYQPKQYYRIKLTNEKQDISQIVLRNDDGVFVLTPHLQKSFRFQSDWPNNQGQVYLYQSLVNSILADKDRQFTTDKDTYVFDVAANYQNSALVRQKIWLNQKDLAPRHVQVSDANANLMLEVDFTEFKFGAKFDKDSFDMQRNMTSMTLPGVQPTAQQDGQAAAKAGDNGKGTAANTQGTQGTAAGTQGTAQGATAGKTDATAGKTDAAGKATTGTQQGAAAGTQTQGAAAGTQGTAQGAAAGKTDATAGKTDAAGKAVTGTQQGAAAGKQTQSTTPSAASGKTDAAGKATTGTQPNAAANKGADNGKTAAATQAPPASNDKATASNDLDFGVIYPSYTPQGVKHSDAAQIKIGDENAILIHYTGTYNYNLVELKPEAKETYLVSSDVVDLGFTIGVLSGDEKKTLIWTDDGIEYRLSTADLPQNEMIHIAQTVQGQLGK